MNTAEVSVHSRSVFLLNLKVVTRPSLRNNPVAISSGVINIAEWFVVRAKQKIIVAFLICTVGLFGLLWSDHSTQVGASRGAASKTQSQTIKRSLKGSEEDLRKLVASLPLSFEPNAGQLSGQVKVCCAGRGL